MAAGSRVEDRETLYGALALAAAASAVIWTFRLMALDAGRADNTGLLAVLASLVFLVGLAFHALKLKVLWLASVVMACGMFVLAAALWVPVERHVAGWAAATVLAYAGVCAFVATQWSKQWFRRAVAVGLVATVLVALKVGRTEEDEKRLRSVRAVAADLDRRVAEVIMTSAAAVEKAKGASTTAYEAARGAIRSAVGPTFSVPDRCPEVAPGRVDTELCVVMRELADPAARMRAAERLDAARQRLSLDAAERPRVDLVAAALAAAAGVSTATSKETTVREAVAKTRLKTEKLCSSAAGQMEGAEPPRTCRANGEAGQRPRVLAVTRADAERDVAELENLQLASDASKAALASTEVALATARTEAGSPTSGTPIITVLSAGGARIARAVPGLGGTRVPIGLTALGWAVLGTLALWGYRRLEITNSGLGLGLVSIDKLKGGANDNAELDAAFRRHVIANVPEPGTVPGATTSSVSDLLETAGDPASKILASLLKIVRGLAASTAGFKVDATYESVGRRATEEDARKEDTKKEDVTSLGSGTHEVFVRVCDARTGATRSTKTVRGDTAALAVRNAGYWAAAHILAFDRSSPSWVAWSEGSSSALAAYDASEALGGEKGVALLEEAVSRAPTCGQVLVRLANARDLEGDFVGALELHLRAATRHPRYMVPRYRIPVALANVAADVPARWDPLGISGQRRLVEALRRCCAACGITADDQLTTLEKGILSGSSGQVRDQVCDVAQLFRISAQDLLGWYTVAMNSLRRSERKIWAQMLFDARGREDRKRLSGMIEISGFVVGVRKDEGPSAKADQRVARLSTERSWWQVIYNAACYHAVVAASTGGPDRRVDAVQLLERLLEHDGSGQLSHAWIDMDPDLDALRLDTRFVEFRSRLPELSS